VRCIGSYRPAGQFHCTVPPRLCVHAIFHGLREGGGEPACACGCVYACLALVPAVAECRRLTAVEGAPRDFLVRQRPARLCNRTVCMSNATTCVEPARVSRSVGSPPVVDRADGYREGGGCGHGAAHMYVCAPELSSCDGAHARDRVSLEPCASRGACGALWWTVHRRGGAVPGSL
jgi:hypothetical protein